MNGLHRTVLFFANSLHSSTVISYLHNQIQHKNKIRIVKTVSPCGVSIRRGEQYIHNIHTYIDTPSIDADAHAIPILVLYAEYDSVKNAYYLVDKPIKGKKLWPLDTQ